MFPWFSFGRNRHTAQLDQQAPLDSLRYVVVDTELTSLDARSNRLLSVGAIAMRGARICLGEQFYQVVNPGVEVPSTSVLIHKLRPADVANGSPPGKVLASFRRFSEGAILVGHFVEIDTKVLRKELAGSLQTLDNPAIDTARVHRWIVRHKPYSPDMFRRLENLDLESVAGFYNVELKQAHHAMDDAFATARVFQRMIRELERLGITTCGKLLRIGAV